MSGSQTPAIAALWPRPQPRWLLLAPSLQRSPDMIWLQAYYLCLTGLHAAWTVGGASAGREAEEASRHSARGNKAQPCLQALDQEANSDSCGCGRAAAR